MQDALAQQDNPSCSCCKRLTKREGGGVRGGSAPLSLSVPSPSAPTPPLLPVQPRRLTLYNRCSPVRLRPLHTHTHSYTHTRTVRDTEAQFSPLCVRGISLCTERQVSEREREKKNPTKNKTKQTFRSTAAGQHAELIFHAELNYGVRPSPVLINLPGTIHSL